MSPSIKPLRLSARVASALGLLSISLTGEITLSWLVAGWLTWSLSLFSDYYPSIGAGVRKFETLAVAGMIGMLFLDFFVLHNSIFIAITHFLLLFQIVKLAGEKTRKDCLQIFLFAFFQILAACTLSVDAWHAAVLLALIPTSTAALFWNQMERESEIVQGPRSDVGLRTSDIERHYRRMAALMCAFALPLNVILTIAVFVIFPRLTFNASLPGFSGRRAGYTDQVNLAQKGSLQQDSAVVLWLSFPKPEERARWDGYLKGDVLSQFNGKEWTAARTLRPRLITADSNGLFILQVQNPRLPFIHQSITLADTSASTLFTLGKPIRIFSPLPSLQENEGGSLHWTASWHRPLRYEVVSQALPDTVLSDADLQLPKIPLEKIRALAEKVAGKSSAAEQARHIEQYLQTNYRYTLSYGDQVTENPVETFLFERREGMCGHFASAMALMLRLRHIPSRLVAGYIKGEWNEPAQCVVIRERDAHAWVEAYIEGRGWVTFDPSPRVVDGTTLSRRSFMHTLVQYGDFFDLEWNRFVIQYDLYAQIKAFENLKESSGHFGAALASWWSKAQIRFHHPGKSVGENQEAQQPIPSSFPWKEGALIIFLALIGACLMIRKQSRTNHSAIRFYIQFLDRMARAGFPKAPAETGWEFAARIEHTVPDRTDLARRITEKYYQTRFDQLQ